MLGINLKLIRESWRLSQTEFGVVIGGSRGMVMQYEIRGSWSPKTPQAKRIERYTDMTIAELSAKLLAIDDVPSIPDEVQEIVDRIRSSDKKKFGATNVTTGGTSGVDIINKAKPQNGNCFYVPVKAFGGFLEGYDDVYFLSTLEKRSHPDIIGDCYAFEVEGFSMYKHKVIDGEVYESGYKPGGHVVTTPVNDPKHLVKGKDYVFVTTEGVIIKRFEKIDKEECYLKSINDEYNPVKPLKLKTIKKVFYVQKKYV